MDNRFDRVLNCLAVNGDGAEIMNALQLNNKNIQDAVRETIQKIADAGYFKGEEADIMIAASSKSNQKSEELAEQLKQTAAEEAAMDNLNVNLEAVGVEPKYVQQAKELGVTPGKLVLVSKLEDGCSKLSEEEIKTWMDSPVKDLMKQIQENEKAQKAVSENGKDKGNQDATTPANPGNNGQSGTVKANAKGNSTGNESGKKDTKENEGNNNNKNTKANNTSKNAG